MPLASPLPRLLENVLPCSARYCEPHSFFSDAEHMSQPRTRSVARLVNLSRRSNPFVVKKCSRSRYTTRRSALRISIRVVIFICAKEEMIRVHARWIIAMMQNAHFTWNWAKVNLPRYAMRFIGTIVPRRGAVALRVVKPACPKPTAVGLNNTSPEPCFLLRNLVNTRTLPRTARSVHHGARVDGEFDLADNTRFCYFRVSQDVNLQDRFALRSGPFGRRDLSFGLFAFYHGRIEPC